MPGLRFLRAYLQGIAQYNQGKNPRNLEILSQVTQLEADLLQRICWPSFAADGQVDAQAISKYAAWAQDRGLADKALAPAEFWEPRLAAKSIARHCRHPATRVRRSKRPLYHHAHL